MVGKIQRLIAPLARRVRLMIGRSIITMVDDATKEQQLQVSLLADEVHDDVERYQEYGFTSVPRPGAEAIVVFPAGVRDHGIVIATGDRRYRLKGLKEGEVALYTDEGDAVHLKRGRVVEISTNTLQVNASTKVVFDTPTLECTGTVKDLSDSDGNTMDAMRDTYNSHTHPGDSGGTTGTPSGAM